jgi:hypothetical protein
MTQTCRPSPSIMPQLSMTLLDGRFHPMDALRQRVVACVGREMFVAAGWARLVSGVSLVCRAARTVNPSDPGKQRREFTGGTPSMPSQARCHRRSSGVRRRCLYTPCPAALLRELAVSQLAPPARRWSSSGPAALPGLPDPLVFPDRQAEPGQWFVVPSVAVVSCRCTMVASFSPGRRLPWQTFRRC